MPARTYERVHLALQQLNTALVLFLDDHNYPAAITLAGAAEEIFGNSLRQRGQKWHLESSYEFAAEFHRGRYGQDLEKKKFISMENAARDALKHLQDKGPFITLDLEEAAATLLFRACMNALDLQLPSPRSEEFFHWFRVHMVQI